MQKIKKDLESSTIKENKKSSLLDDIIEATNTFPNDEGYEQTKKGFEVFLSYVNKFQTVGKSNSPTNPQMTVFEGKDIVKNSTIEKTSNIGIVVDEIEGDFLIESNGRKQLSKKAVSCLVLPQIGDKVSLFFDDNKIYIINILSSKKALILKADELTLDIEKINLKSNFFDINIENITSKISNFHAFIRNIDLSSIFTKFNSTDIQVTAQMKKEFTQFRVNQYETLETKISSIEKKEANIVKKNINIEHKNIGSMFTKASGQIKLDAENINFG